MIEGQKQTKCMGIKCDNLKSGHEGPNVLCYILTVNSKFLFVSSALCLMGCDLEWILKQIQPEGPAIIVYRDVWLELSLLDLTIQYNPFGKTKKYSY